ncbi:MAG: hypothetical protein ABI698_09210, partial [bacterium]
MRNPRNLRMLFVLFAACCLLFSSIHDSRFTVRGSQFTFLPAVHCLLFAVCCKVIRHAAAKACANYWACGDGGLRR